MIALLFLLGAAKSYEPWLVVLGLITWGGLTILSFMEFKKKEPVKQAENS